MQLTVSRDSEQELFQDAVVELGSPPGDIPTSRPTSRAQRGCPPIDIVEEWGLQSFAASDPPANW